MGTAGNKTKPTNADVGKFIAGISDGQRRMDCLTLVDMMQKITGHEPRMWGPSIVGFDSFHYRYASGREGDACLAGFSPRKQAIVIYVMAGLDQYAALLGRLGKHKAGKGCLYIKRLDDVNVPVLRDLIAKSAAALKAMYP